MLKKILIPIGVMAIIASAQVASAQITVEPLILHSRDVGAGSPGPTMPYFSSDDPIANTSAASSVGGNAAANGGPGGSFYTSANFGVVGARSGAWLLDSTSLGLTLSGSYDLDITWGTQTSLRTIRVEITDADGLSVVHNVDQNAGVNTWLNLGTFTFSGGSGQEVRLWSNEGTSGSGNMQYDSIRLTPVPEPSTIALGLLGGVGIFAGYLRRRK